MAGATRSSQAKILLCHGGYFVRENSENFSPKNEKQLENPMTTTTEIISD
jgi:hypothetical protein